MAENKLGGLQIVEDSRSAFRRLSMRFRRRFTTRPVRWRRRITSGVIIAALVVAGIVWRNREVVFDMFAAERMVTNLGALCRGVKALAVVRGGELALVPNEDLLAEVVRRGYVEPGLATSVHGYEVLSVHQAQKVPPLYTITVRCAEDEACADLRATTLGQPEFLAARSPAANPLALTFALRHQRRD